MAHRLAASALLTLAFALSGATAAFATTEDAYLDYVDDDDYGYVCGKSAERSARVVELPAIPGDDELVAGAGEGDYVDEDADDSAWEDAQWEDLEDGDDSSGDCEELLEDEDDDYYDGEEEDFEDEDLSDEDEDLDEGGDGPVRGDRNGSRGDDHLVGDAGANRFFGFAGNDFLDGAGGADHLNGGPGDDTLVTGAEAGQAVAGGARKRRNRKGDRDTARHAKRVAGKGDMVDAGRGDDTIRARNGRADKVKCGGGDDTVFAERGDTVRRNCETVKYA